MSGENLWSYMDRDEDGAELGTAGPDKLYLAAPEGVYLTEDAVAGLTSVMTNWLAGKQRARREKERREKERQEMGAYLASQRVRDMHTQSVDDDERWATAAKDMAAMREQLTQIDLRMAQLEGATEVRDQTYASAAYQAPERIDVTCQCKHPYSVHGVTGKCNDVDEIPGSVRLCSCSRFRLGLPT